MHRFYAEPDDSGSSLVRLSEEDAYHAVKVLRMQAGDSAEVFLQGSRLLASVESVSGGNVFLRILQPLQSTEPGLFVTLFQGLPKGDKMDWIVQKSVELGVSRIVPVSFSRSVIRLDGKDALRKQERWQKIAREAGKQSGRCIIPEVSVPVSFPDLQELLSVPDFVAVPWEGCTNGGPLSFVRRHPSLSSIGIVIGPEGGISREEIERLTAWGCETVTLGKRILRTETAGLAAVSALFGLYGEME